MDTESIVVCSSYSVHHLHTDIMLYNNCYDTYVFTHALSRFYTYNIWYISYAENSEKKENSLVNNYEYRFTLIGLYL